MREISLRRPLVCFDLETTGVDVESDRVVQIACVKLHPDGSMEEKERLIHPGRPIPSEATAVHGISDSDVRESLVFPTIARSLLGFLSDCDITGYNVAAFDVPMLTAEFRRCSIQWPAPDDDVRVVDAFSIFRLQEPQTLENAHRYYVGEEMQGNAHDALADTKAALGVLLAQVRRYHQRDSPPTLADAMEMQRDKDWVDKTGKVKWQGDVAVLNFGKWCGRPLSQIDSGYFSWVIRQDFPADFKDICRNALRGKCPVREHQSDLPGM